MSVRLTDLARAGFSALSEAAEAIERLQFGVVQLVVHDGRVVQLEVTERQRFA